jgi:hypothetical protein
MIAYLTCSAVINATATPSSTSIQVLGIIFVIFSFGYVVAGFQGTPTQFHVITALTCFYMASVLTNWNPPDYSDLSNESNNLLIDKGIPALWVKISVTWINSLLYIWTLLGKKISIISISTYYVPRS